MKLRPSIENVIFSTYKTCPYYCSYSLNSAAFKGWNSTVIHIAFYTLHIFFVFLLF